MSSESEIVNVENRIISIRGQEVILDRDVAELYGVPTKEVNRAVRNNPDKFPTGYVFELQQSEKQEVVKNFHHLESVKYSLVTPRAFTEKGLYMLATILKSQVATQTTIAIIETFAKVRELKRGLVELHKEKDKEEDK